MDIDIEVEEMEDLEELASSQKEMQELDQRAWGYRLESSQLRASRLESSRGMAAPASNTDFRSIDEGMEALS